MGEKPREIKYERLEEKLNEIEYCAQMSGLQDSCMLEEFRQRNEEKLRDFMFAYRAAEQIYLMPSVKGNTDLDSLRVGVQTDNGRLIQELQEVFYQLTPQADPLDPLGKNAGLFFEKDGTLKQDAMGHLERYLGKQIVLHLETV